MRKPICMILILALCAALSACDGAKPDRTTEGSTGQTTVGTQSGAPDTTDDGDPLPTPSEGLEYSKVSNADCYSVAGIGSCTDTKIVIPAEYNGLPVKYIDNEAFKNCTELKSVTLPEGLISIGNDAFYGCKKLTSIVIPESVDGIGVGAFYGCTVLRSVSFGRGVKSFDGGNFYDCYRLKDIYYSGTVEEWKAIFKYYGWDMNTPDYTVHCSDGDVAKGK